MGEAGENPGEMRNPDGTWKPGNPYAFDGSKAGPGRPPKDAWLRELEQQLQNDPAKATLMAEEVYRIATAGDDDKVRLNALREIQDRIGGPVVRETKGELNIVTHAITLKDRAQPEPPQEEIPQYDDR